jgi:ribosome biogenesis protein MAK21
MVENKEARQRRRGQKGKNNPSSTLNKNYSNGNHSKDSSSSRVDYQSPNNGIDDRTPVSIYKPHKTLLIHLTEDTPTWWECGRNTAGRDDTIFTYKQESDAAKKVKTNSPQIISKYRDLADSIYKQEVSLFRASSSANSDADEKWVEGTMKHGTLKDRIAAMSVIVSTNPIHKLYALDMLLNLAGVSTHNNIHDNNANNQHHHRPQTNQRVCQMAAEALTDLFSNTLLPKHRKLIGIEARPLYLYENDIKNDTRTKQNHQQQQRNISPRLLLLWRYEEMLKTKYADFLSQYLARTLSINSGTAIDLTKTGALRTASSLFKEIPEGEQVLLSLIVNKIGDPSKKTAAAAAHELRGVLQTHPSMTKIVAREIQQLAHRPNLSARSLYNCIIFLNQLKLVKEEENNIVGNKTKSNNKDTSLPASLISTYFQLFEVAVKKSESEGKDSTSKGASVMKSRLLGALLTGVNRAHPYLPKKDEGMDQHIDALYRIAHISPPSVSTQALTLLFHLAIGSGVEAKKNTDPSSSLSVGEIARQDRFYRALYSKIADPSMFSGRQLTLFFNLIYKAMKYDTNKLRVNAFSKRLLHMSFHHNPAVISGSIFLLSEIMKYHPSLDICVSGTDGHGTIFDPSKRDPKVAFDSQNSTNENDQESLTSNQNENPATLWELSMTSHHYHPTVSKFSSSFGNISYTGDPLRDFTLIPFLDKFAFRNPKSTKKISKHLIRRVSVGERRSGLEGKFNALLSLPVNDPEFLKKESEKVAEGEEFFHKFFLERAKRDEMKGVVRGKDVRTDEDGAFDNAERDEDDINWDSDPEEEEFVQSLAERLMESSGNGKANFDDEDPDLEDWSDYEGSDEDVTNDDIDYSALDGLTKNMDESDDDSDLYDDSSVLDEEDEGGEDNLEDPFSHDSNGSDDDDMMMQAFNTEYNSEDDSDNSSIKDAIQNKKKSDKNKKENKKNKNKSMFADASEYESMINAAWTEQMENKKRGIEDISDTEDIDQTLVDEDNTKKKKRRKKKVKK